MFWPSPGVLGAISSGYGHHAIPADLTALKHPEHRVDQPAAGATGVSDSRKLGDDLLTELCERFGSRQVGQRHVHALDPPLGQRGEIVDELWS